jgi:hypothetical protein
MFPVGWDYGWIGQKIPTFIYVIRSTFIYLMVRKDTFGSFGVFVGKHGLGCLGVEW